MKNISILMLCAVQLLLCSTSNAQSERRIITPPKGAKIVLTVQNASVSIEGYDGDDIIFESSAQNEQEKNIPAAANGLKDLTAQQNPRQFYDESFAWGNSKSDGIDVQNFSVVRVNGQSLGVRADNTVNFLSGSDTLRVSKKGIVVTPPGVVPPAAVRVIVPGDAVDLTRVPTGAANVFNVEGFNILGSSPYKVTEGINPVIKETAASYSIGLSFNTNREISIKVPRNIHLQFTSSSYLGSPKASLKNLNGEVEISTSASSVTVDNVPGLTSLYSRKVNAGIGKIVIKNSKWLSPKQTSLGPVRPIFITAINSVLDISLPAELKASLSVDTAKGDLYSDLNLQQEEKTTSVVVSSLSKNKYVGTLNGGGVPITIRSEYGNVLLRKAK